MKEPFTEKRPWGEFRQFTKNESTTVKTILVRKGEALSLQYHAKRSEFWIILKGSPEITINEKVVVAKPGDEFVIPIQAKHRVRALDEDVEFLEIAEGDFDEDDIVRIEDAYGRVH